MNQIQGGIRIAEAGCNKISKNFDYLQREVKKWSDDNLPKPVADIVQKAFLGLPIALGYLFLPAPLVASSLITYGVITLVNPTIICKNSHEFIRNGLFVGIGAEAIKDACIFAVTGNPIMGISAIISGVSASFLYKKTI